MASIAGIEMGRLRGSGGFADVFEANEAALSRVVAVKLFRARVGGEDRRSFEREAHAMGRLSGIRNVVHVYRSGVTEDDHPYLVMELMDGSLADLLTQGPVPARDVCRAGVLIGQALAAAHAEGVLHRDIKPANILIDRYGEPALSDFGIATLADSGSNSFLYAFTAEHAAPEVFDHTDPSPAADVYSLASTLYAAMEGHPAFTREENEGAMTFMRRVQEAPCPPCTAAAALDPELDVLLRAAMSKEPADRPSLDEFIARLAPFVGAIESQPGGAALPAPPRPRPMPTSGTPTGEPDAVASVGDPSISSASASHSLQPDRRPTSTGRRNLAIAAVVIVLVGAGAGAIAWGSGDRGTPEALDAKTTDSVDSAGGETTTTEADGPTTSLPLEYQQRPPGAANARPADDPGLSDTSGKLRSNLAAFAATTDTPAVVAPTFRQELDGTALKFGVLPAKVDYSATNALPTDECLSIYLDDLVVTGAAGAVWTNGQESVGLNAIEFSTETQAKQAYWTASLFNGLSDKNCSGWPQNRVAINPEDLSVSRQDFPLTAATDDLVTAIDDSPDLLGLDGGIQYQVTARIGTTVILASVGSASEGMDPTTAAAVLDDALNAFAGS